MITVEKHLAVMINGFTVNVYIVTDVETGVTAVIDPSLPEKELLKKLEGKDVQYIFFTHGHSDHSCGAKMIKENTGAKTVIHKDEEEMFHDIYKNQFHVNCELLDTDFPDVDIDILADDGTELVLGNTIVTVMHTPGHSMGSVCYLFKEDGIMFSGDTLFRLTAGRVDLYGGDARAELMSLAKIGELEGDYKVYPGHEEETTLDFERQYNRYMKTRFRKR